MNEKLKQLILGKRHHFAIQIPDESLAKADKESRTIPMTFAAPSYVPRWYGILVLNFDEKSVRMDRWKQGAPYLMDHDTFDQRGIIENGKLENSVLSGEVRFSRNQKGQELFNDVVDRIRPYTSVGFDIHKIREMTPEEMPEDLKNMCLEKECKAYMCEDWEPLEGSSVALGANPGVGVQYDYYEGESAETIQVLREKFEIEKYDIEKASKITIKQTTIEGANTMAYETKTPEDVLKEERQRVAGIEATAAKFVGRVDKIDELKVQAIQNGVSVEAFKGIIADKLSDDKPIFTPETQLGLSEKEKKNFSLLRAIQSSIPGSGVKAEFERECSNEIARKLNKPTKGFYIPQDIQMRNMAVSKEQYAALREKFDLTVGNATQAGNLVGTTLYGADFISMLRNRAAAGKFGAKIWSGLVGNVAIPRQTAAGTFYWVAEGGTPTESQLSIGQLQMSPNIGAAYQEYSTMLLLQSTPSVESIVQDDLFTIATLGVDAAVFHGAGGNEPTGLANTSGVGSVNGTALGWAGVLEFESDIATANADVANMKYVMNAAARGLLKGREKTAGYPAYLMDEQGRMNGYESIVSQQINNGYIFFGDGSQLVIGEWGIMELLVNPYIKDIEGLVRVSIRVHVDVGVKQPAAFTITSNLS